MHTCITFSVDEKYLRLVSPRGRKFGIIDTPQNFEVPLPVSQKRIEIPQNFVHRCIQRPNIWRETKIWKLWTSRFCKIGFKWNF